MWNTHLRQIIPAGFFIEQAGEIDHRFIVNGYHHIRVFHIMHPGHMFIANPLDSMELYQSRLVEMKMEFGEYTESDAAAHFARYLSGVSTDNMVELTYAERRRVHNLKYFTWVEQQGRTYAEIQAQWHNQNYWSDFQKQIPEMDALIEEFNARVGLS